MRARCSRVFGEALIKWPPRPATFHVQKLAVLSRDFLNVDREFLQTPGGGALESGNMKTGSSFFGTMAIKEPLIWKGSPKLVRPAKRPEVQIGRSFAPFRGLTCQLLSQALYRPHDLVLRRIVGRLPLKHQLQKLKGLRGEVYGLAADG